MRKNILLLGLFTILGGLVIAQQSPCSPTSITPTTDGACTMISATAPATVSTWSTSTNSSLTSGLVNTCNSTQAAGSGNLWYTFTVPATGDLDISIGFTNAGGGNVQNPEFQLYQYTGGSCATTNLSLSYVGCGNGSGGASSGTFAATPGATYYVRMYDDDADKDINGEKYKYCFGFAARNDNCANATAVTPGTPIYESTLGSSLDAPFTGGGWCPTGNVWYTFTTGASPGCYSFFMTQATAGCNYVTVYQGGCPGTGGTLLNNNVSTNTFNDQGSSEPGFGGMLPNTTYYVSVANATSGAFTLNIQPSVTAASNDQCSGATGISPTALVTDNAVAGCEYSYVAAQDASITPANICAGSLENVSWFTFQTQATPATSNVVISFSGITCNNGGGGFQTGLFTGTCGSLTATGSCAAGASGTVTYTINNSPANTVYYIAMDGNAGSNCHFTVSGTNIVPLPIELLTFDAVPKGSKEVNVSWSTATEDNNDYFTIERTTDGVNFEVIGVMASQAVNGNSSSVLNYSKVDSKPYRGTSYYRLKQTDYDGNSSYSALKAVQIDEFADLNFIVYPNPTGENENTYLQFSGNADDEVQISIVDVTGKLVSQKGIVLSSAGNTTIELKHNFSSGMYFINATSRLGASFHQKLMVK